MATHDRRRGEAQQQSDEAGAATIGHWIGETAEEFAAAEALMGSVGEAIIRFDTGRMRLLGTTQPSRLERLIAEFQLGDPTSTRDAFRPWKRRSRCDRPPNLVQRRLKLRPEKWLDKTDLRGM